mmetsp:Transcript_8115/g.10265  ORF Transcript_8115/g.10265 Transcript_8115/m.10265 type:complete len:142 (+) Transcript_8115:402-827(+)
MGMDRFNKNSWLLTKCWGACTGNQPIFFIKIDILPSDLHQENTGSKRNLVLTSHLSSSSSLKTTKTKKALVTKNKSTTSNDSPNYPCPSCGTKTTENAKFCHDCGHKLVCPNCGTNTTENSKFCHKCGKKLAESLHHIANG